MSHITIHSENGRRHEVDVGTAEITATDCWRAKPAYPTSIQNTRSI